MTDLADALADAPPAAAKRRPLILLFGAGVGGGAWSALMQIAATPFYLRLLGVESYGLIGFYTAMQSLLQVLDMGMSLTISRETARLRAEHRTTELRDLTRTVEFAYVAIGILVGVALFASAPLIATRWLNAADLGRPELERVLRMMAVLWTAQWMTSFYQSVLIGLERLGTLNLLKAVAATAMHAGGVLWLWRISPRPFELFAFQAVVVALHAAVIATVVKTALPASSEPARINISLIRERGRFAGVMAGVTIFGALLTQSDKVIVSRLLPLRELGFYSLASLVAQALFIFIIPMFQAVLPRLTAAVAIGDERATHELYRGATQALTVLAVAPAAFLIFRGAEVISLWTHDPMLAQRTSTVAALLVAGTALNAILTAAYAMQIATGRTRFTLATAASLFACFVPLVIFLGHRYGTVGVAAAWPIVHFASLSVGVIYTQTRLVHATILEWLSDAAPPALAALAAAALVSRVPVPASTIVRLFILVISSVFVLAAAVAAAPRVRAAVLVFARSRVRG